MLHQLVLASVLAAILIGLVGLYATTAGERSLRRAIERRSAAHAGAVISEIDRVMHTRITQWMAYSNRPLVRRTLESSNSQFDRLPDRQAYIDKVDSAWWIAAAQSPTPMSQELASNELALDLQATLAGLEEQSGYPVFGDVFITNRFGADGLTAPGANARRRRDGQEYDRRRQLVYAHHRSRTIGERQND